MRCVVPFCEHDSHTICSQEITFFKFPSEPSLLEAWLEALQKGGWQPRGDSAVCSKHFVPEDLLENESGLSVLRADAVPVMDVRVCGICFTTEGKLYPIKAYKTLYQAYENLTGLLLENEDNLPLYLCNECVRQLLKCARFRTVSLKAHLLLLEIVRKYNHITPQSIQSVNSQRSQFSLNLTHCQTDESDLEMELLENEDVSISKEIIPRNIAGMLDAMVYNIKLETDAVNPNMHYNDNTVSVTKLPDNTVVDVKVENVCEDIAGLDIKIENDVDDHQINDSMTNNNRVDSFKVGNKGDNINVANNTATNVDKYISEVKLTGKVRQKVKLYPSGVHRVTHAKVNSTNNHQKSASEGGLPSGDKLSCDKGSKSSRKPYSCDICSKTFSKKCQLQVHLRTHSGVKPFSCDVCNKTFGYKISLQRHSLLHSDVKPFSCDVCNRSFVDKNVLQRHFVTHSDERPYSCSVCGKSFSRQSYLTIHLQIHSGKKPYSCNICGKAFVINVELNKHMRMHSGIEPFSCNICQKAFLRKNQLQMHMRTHSGEKPYSCHVCNKAFSQKISLQRHSLIHSGDKPYSCGVCNKPFSRKGYLQTHMRIHSGERPYSCDVCKKKFCTKAQMQVHLRLHSGEKPFSCDVCNRNFSTKGQLQTHQRVHSGEKPYQCNVCNKAFARKAGLQNHLKMHSRN